MSASGNSSTPKKFTFGNAAAAASTPPSHVIVHMMNDRHIEVPLPRDKNARVSELKKTIFQQEGISPERQRLLYHGRALDSNKTLAQEGVTHGCALHLVEKAPGLQDRPSSAPREQGNAIASARSPGENVQRFVQGVAPQLQNIAPHVLAGIQEVTNEADLDPTPGARITRCFSISGPFDEEHLRAAAQLATQPRIHPSASAAQGTSVAGTQAMGPRQADLGATQAAAAVDQSAAAARGAAQSSPRDSTAMQDAQPKDKKARIQRARTIAKKKFVVPENASFGLHVAPSDLTPQSMETLMAQARELVATGEPSTADADAAAGQWRVATACHELNHHVNRCDEVVNELTNALDEQQHEDVAPDTMAYLGCLADQFQRMADICGLLSMRTEAGNTRQFWSPSEAMKRPLESAVNASPEKLSEEYKQLQELQERRHALEGEIAHINRELSEETAHRKACEKRLSPSMPQESRKALTVSINVALERETALGASLSKLQVEKDRLLRAETALSAQLAPRDAEASAASRSGSVGASSQAAAQAADNSPANVATATAAASSAAAAPPQKAATPPGTAAASSAAAASPRKTAAPPQSEVPAAKGTAPVGRGATPQHKGEATSATGPRQPVKQLGSIILRAAEAVNAMPILDTDVVAKLRETSLPRVYANLYD